MDIKYNNVFLVMIILIVGLFVSTASACGTVPTSEVLRDGSDSGTVVSIAAMNSRRAAHTATLLANGKVLIVGGFVGNGGGLATAELFDPTTNAFEQAENMTAGRSSHTATLLPNGKVLIAGGFNGEYLNSSEIYDPSTGKFTPAARMTRARSGQVAVLLKNGKVLFAGGVGTGWTFLSDAELYDPAKNTFETTGEMLTARESHTATLLKDGRVLISGGHKGRRAAMTIYDSTEIYNPTLAKFAAGPNLTIRRHKHEATLLADGRVLILGGSDERDGNGAYRNAEIFDPTKGKFVAVKNNMNTERYKLQGTAILLKNGKVLVAGGADRAEVFDPTTDSFTLAAGDMGTKRLFATATLLKDGQVLITGGYTDGPRVSSDAWIYRV